ncbi:RsmD family RNA methyltransferase [Candidatus Poriferisodalis sp.]|uniref:RsmD family RNA methyltransferase n=1 Tax=Candidatus Poriferisodalis sp. TaxID=3101277 RepID=UPI003B01D7C3
MRVVGGSLSGRRLQAPGQGVNSIRPTSDRVREAVFNMLDSLHAPAGVTVADLFAGTGALGIEALSRGAAHATFVEHDAAACSIITASLAALELSERADIVRGDVLPYIARRADPVDLAFADPPYSFDGWSELLSTLSADVLVCESDREIEPDSDHTWRTARVRRYGTPVITILVQR